MTQVGLRIDVDTFRGTRDGIPRLLESLAAHDIKATFFLTTGPDNMGRHLWRLANPAFLIKMLRSHAASLYGWDILLAGTLWPGRRIAAALGDVIRSAAAAGHEMGLHAWDHHRWQTQIDRLPREGIRAEIERGFDALAATLGEPPRCSAVAGWRVTEEVLEIKESFEFRYNSDCRGRAMFRPIVGGALLTPQIPVTLPTYDELIGRDGVTDETYNERLLALIEPAQLNVLTIHAEVEGIVCAGMFDAFLRRARERELEFVPLGELLETAQDLPTDTLAQAPIEGRAGVVGWQRSALAAA
jgi:undecaprenyl phosphate-alpha-L-ara4FN deformylase